MNRSACSALLIGLVLGSIPAAGGETPIPVILDTDIGNDIDDTWALAMMLGSPEIELRLIVTSMGDTSERTRLVAKLLERLDRTDVPIGTGVRTDQAHLNQAAWVGDYDLTKYPGTIREDGVQALIDAIHAAPEGVVICVIGPQTNVAEALRRDPSIAGRARIVSMAGSVRVGYDGGPSPDPEWNVAVDAPAARAVLAAPWPVTYAPLDSCGQLRVDGERYARFEASKAPRARVVAENYDIWTPRHSKAVDASSILFDTVAVHLIFDESLYDMETVNLRVDDQGKTVEDADGRPVRCAMRLRDPVAMQELILNRLGVEPAPIAETVAAE